jgi:hypothetical protein
LGAPKGISKCANKTAIFINPHTVGGYLGALFSKGVILFQLSFTVSIQRFALCCVGANLFEIMMNIPIRLASYQELKRLKIAAHYKTISNPGGDKVPSFNPSK